MKKSICGPADLAEAMASNNRELVRSLAGMMGLEPPVTDIGSQAEDQESDPVTPKLPEVQPPRQEKIDVRPPLTDIPFWRVERYQQQDSKQPVPDEPPRCVRWEAKPGSPPPLTPLNCWPSLLPRLKRGAALQRDSRTPDMEQAVLQISRLEAITDIPFIPEWNWNGRIQLVVDRSDRLVPYWEDQDLVTGHLLDTFPRQGIELCSFWEGMEEPCSLRDLDEGLSYRLPRPGSLVLALGDLGCLAEDNGEEAAIWQSMGRRLRRHSCRTVALVPGLSNDIVRKQKNCWQVVPWETMPGAPTLPLEELRKQVEHLVRLLSYATRIEPALLRQTRLLCGYDPCCEALFWQHEAVTSMSSVAASVSGKIMKARRPDLSEQSSEHDLLVDVLELQARWRRGLPPEIWFSELLNLASESHLSPQIEDDLHQARQFFKDLSNCIRAGEPQPGTDSWFYWLMPYLSDQAWSGADEGMKQALDQLCFHAVKDKPGTELPPNYDPANIHSSPDQPIQTFNLLQKGSRMVLERASVSGAGANSGQASPLATLRSRNGQVVVKEQPWDNPADFWKGGKPPSWASAWGRDRYGLFAEFTVAREEEPGIVQRMRWLEPGRFLMGSPGDEHERNDDEGPQHKVTISHGFWLWDSACTQELWQAVMKKNPSRFKGEYRPVEKVSWNNVRDFLQKLNRMFDNLDLTLPSEAQWEYGCRAGTTTPFSFGSDLTPELVNYNGNFPYKSKEKGLYRQETVEVATLPPNGWGLYEMHGNVWEWCLDGLRDYSRAAIIDPLGPVGSGSRVVRGGSWGNYARGVRSAFRVAREPGLRYDYLGFRCARVQKQEKEKKPAEPAAGSDQVRDERVRTQSGSAMIRLARDETTGTRPWPNKPLDILIRTDMEQLNLGCLSKPDWAEQIGRDGFGLWAGFFMQPALGRAIFQRMRWIPPGRFKMGSPDNEPERWDSEGPQHEVVISQGFWLADTTCSQALWQAVMEENPSGFKGEKRPVEQVSWEDIQEFLRRINQQQPGLNLTLPTEAQWEYGCRAGTTGPFSFAGNISPEQVNYNGNYPYSSGSKGLYREETVEIGSLPPNLWGLYEMHGNVYEWCLDGKRKYKNEVEVDPVGSLKEGGSRVIRGGSWYSSAWYVRSAYRFAREPGDRIAFLGFRCARVQKQEKKKK